MRISKNKTLQMIFLGVIALLAGLIFLESPGTTDVNIWRSWTTNASDLGLVGGFRANRADYPPIASAILLAGYRTFHPAGFTQFETIKLTILVFLLATALIFWIWTRNLIWTLVLYASLLMNSAALGYIDIFFAPSLVLALWMLKERRWGWFSVFYALSCLTKWQPVLIAPFIALYILNIQHPREWRQISLKNILLAILPAAVILGYILFQYKPEYIWLAFKASLSHEYLSGNALNFNWIQTHLIRVFQPEAFGGLNNSLAELITTTDQRYTLLPRVLFYLTYLATLITFFLRKKTFKNLLVFSICGFFAYYTFNTGVHENHLFLVMLLVGALLWVAPNTWRTGLVLILINNINLFVFYGIEGEIHFSRPVIGADMAVLLAVFNLAFFLFYFANTLAWPADTETLQQPAQPARG
jgi:hypothetical protein